MAVGVVNVFESINVGHDDRQRHFLAARPLKFNLELFENCRAVHDSGKSVMGGLMSKFFLRFEKTVLQINDSAACQQSSSEFDGIKWFDDVVVGAGLEAFNDVILSTAGREQNNVDVTWCRFRAEL